MSVYNIQTMTQYETGDFVECYNQADRVKYIGTIIDIDEENNSVKIEVEGIVDDEEPEEVPEVIQTDMIPGKV